MVRHRCAVLNSLRGKKTKQAVKLQYNTIFQNQIKKGRHQKAVTPCSQISLLYNRIPIQVSKLDLANNREARKHSKK